MDKTPTPTQVAWSVREIAGTLRVSKRRSSRLKDGRIRRVKVGSRTLIAR